MKFDNVLQSIGNTPHIRMNRLFGVTMAEKGVSQLVSVDLEAARRMVDTEAA